RGVQDDLARVRVEGRVQFAMACARLDERLHHDGQRADALAGGLLELPAEPIEEERIDAEERGDVRDLARRARHLLGDEAARAPDGDALLALTRRRSGGGGRALLRGLLHVLAGD